MTIVTLAQLYLNQGSLNMTTSIPWINLFWCLIPLMISLTVFKQLNTSLIELGTAWFRMIVQLVLVGFALVLLFNLDSPGYMVLIFIVMTVIASWIAIRPVRHHQGIWLPAVISLLIASGIHLLISLLGVLETPVWYDPSVLIPLSGMYLANTMNCISLSAERFISELEHQPVNGAQVSAFQSAMIPLINGLLAVGVVALPGMMTGQILSGVSPLIAVRFQIMIMAMVFGAGAMGSWLFLKLYSRRY